MRSVGSVAASASSTVTMRSSIVGTTVADVTPSSLTRRTHSRASKLVRYTIFRPAYRFDSAADTPAMWYGGTQISAASLGSAESNSTVPVM